MIALRTIPATSKPVQDLVLIHAFPLTSAMYEDAAKALQKERSDINVHLVDLPGFGGASYLERWTLAEAMQSLHDELLKLGVAAPVIGGTSMGGYAVLAYYRLYPEEVSGLILSNTKAAGDDEEAKKNREVFAQDVEKRSHEAVYERMLDKLISESSRKQDPELRDQLKSSIAASEPRAIASALRMLAVRNDSTALLDEIECPVLIIAGGEDAIMTKEDTKKLQTIRNSHLVDMPGTGHLAPVEAPQKWASAVSTFLTTLVESPI